MSFLSERMIGTAASTVDRAVAAVVRGRGRPGRHETLAHRERIDLLLRVHEAYGAPALFASPDAFFRPPDPIDPRLLPVREARRNGETVVDASWQSRFEPYLPELREKYFRHASNTTAHARLFLHETPRPAVLLIHGYLGGQFRFEEIVWPIRWFYRNGLDVCLVQLPFHGLRATPTKGARPPFPGSDPRMTNEGLRQAMFDVRALVRWLRARGSSEVGAVGMSLGGYATALLATVEPGLAFAVPMIPLASFADFARDSGRLGSRGQQPEQHKALEAANYIVSPFARPSLVSSDRVLIIAAEADRITPISHAERLSHHFAADIVRFPGGHLLQIGVSRGYRRLGELLRRIGVMDAHGGAPPDILPRDVAA